MNRRLLLSSSTAAVMYGLFTVYSHTVSPLFAPPTIDLSQQPLLRNGLERARNTRNREAAEQYLPGTWAADAEFQVRDDDRYLYARQVDDNTAKGEIRFTPFALIWKSEEGSNKQPLTMQADAARVNFDGRIDQATPLSQGTPALGRPTAGTLYGNVVIRGDKGLEITGRDFHYSEEALKVWSDQPVRFRYAGHSGSAAGFEMELHHNDGPPPPNKPAVKGVRLIRLLRSVVMDLDSDRKELPGNADAPAVANADEPRDPVRVQCRGAFEFNLDSNVGEFRDTVMVDRPTGANQFDRIRCQLLRLVLGPKAESTSSSGVAAGNIAATNAASTNANAAGDSSTNGQPPGDAPRDAAGIAANAAAGQGESQSSEFGDDLDFHRMLATGQPVVLTSDKSDLRAEAAELTYDAQARVVVLKDERHVQVNRTRESLTCPEITLQLTEEGDVSFARCRGAGELKSFGKHSNGRVDRNRIAFSAEWLQQLTQGPDPEDATTPMIEFIGHAQLKQPGELTLTGQTIRIWLKKSESDTGTLSATVSGDDSSASVTGAGHSARPVPGIRKLEALKQVTFATPKLKGETEQLWVWFESGRLAPPPPAPETAQTAADLDQHIAAQRREFKAEFGRGDRGRFAHQLPASLLAAELRLQTDRRLRTNRSLYVRRSFGNGLPFAAMRKLLETESATGRRVDLYGFASVPSPAIQPGRTNPNRRGGNGGGANAGGQNAGGAISGADSKGSNSANGRSPNGRLAIKPNRKTNPSVNPAAARSNQTTDVEPRRSRQIERTSGTARDGSPVANRSSAANAPPTFASASHIQVKMLRDGSNDPELAVVLAQGAMHVEQPRADGTGKLEVNGHELLLENYAGLNQQVVTVTGKPAMVLDGTGDRQTQLEGPHILMNRGANHAAVTGSGVLRLPVQQSAKSTAPVPLKGGRLEVTWQESMQFNGEKAEFFDTVVAKLRDDRLQCEEMQVTLSRPISFVDPDSSKASKPTVRQVVCKDRVDVRSHEYRDGKLVGIRQAQAWELTLEQESGDTSARGPGVLTLWRLGNGTRLGASSKTEKTTVRPNASAVAGPPQWEFVRVKFRDTMDGTLQLDQPANTEGAPNVMTFHTDVDVVYGPVTNSGEKIDPNNLPLGAGWLQCADLRIEQHPVPGKTAQLVVIGTGNCRLEGRSKPGVFNGRAETIRHVQAKDMFLMESEGSSEAELWRQAANTPEPSPFAAKRFEFYPATHQVRALAASDLSGS